MKCTKCNTENKTNSKFCVKCGAPLNTAKEKHNIKIIGVIVAVIVIISLCFVVLSFNNQTTQNSVEVDGVAFSVPHEGYFKDYNNYRFNFNGFNCSVKEVKHFESTTENQTLNSVNLDKYYPGAETYSTYFEKSGNTWYGLKVKKENKWFHLSIQTTSKDDAVKYFDWMENANDWEGHR